LTSIIAAYQENGYLAGVLAAKTTRTGKVGIIISATNVDYFNSAGGFARGVHSVDPNMPISFAEISAEGYDDSAGGKRVATSMIAEGVDVIVGLGDDSSFGYLQAIEAADESKSEQEKVWFINAIGDMTPIDKNGVILSAMLVNFNGAYKALVEQLNDGTFGEEPYELNLANGGLAPLKTEHIPAKVWSEIEKVKKEMIAGKIEVPETTKINEVKAALAE
jgi:simple sugar transport system substrate-binding protein